MVVRRKALVLEDVSDYPRFAGNPVVDEFGIRSYLGAPLVDSTGMDAGGRATQGAVAGCPEGAPLGVCFFW